MKPETTTSGGPDHRSAPEREAPWHTQFWPWFLIALPTAAVVASFASLAIALRNADTLVRPDWSAAGESINVELALEQEADRRGVIATIRIDAASNRVTVTLDGIVETMETLSLNLRHPTEAGRDVSLALTNQEARVFIAEASPAMLGSWYLTIAPPGREWLLRKRVWLGTGAATRVGATASGKSRSSDP